MPEPHIFTRRVSPQSIESNENNRRQSRALPKRIEGDYEVRLKVDFINSNMRLLQVYGLTQDNKAEVVLYKREETKLQQYYKGDAGIDSDDLKFEENEEYLYCLKFKKQPSRALLSITPGNGDVIVKEKGLLPYWYVKALNRGPEIISSPISSSSSNEETDTETTSSARKSKSKTTDTAEETEKESDEKHSTTSESRADKSSSKGKSSTSGTSSSEHKSDKGSRTGRSSRSRSTSSDAGTDRDSGKRKSSASGTTSTEHGTDKESGTGRSSRSRSTSSDAGTDRDSTKRKSSASGATSSEPGTDEGSSRRKSSSSRSTSLESGTEKVVSRRKSSGSRSTSSEPGSDRGIRRRKSSGSRSTSSESENDEGGRKRNSTGIIDKEPKRKDSLETNKVQKSLKSRTSSDEDESDRTIGKKTSSSDEDDEQKGSKKGKSTSGSSSKSKSSSKDKTSRSKSESETGQADATTENEAKSTSASSQKSQSTILPNLQIIYRVKKNQMSIALANNQRLPKPLQVALRSVSDKSEVAIDLQDGDVESKMIECKRNTLYTLSMVQPDTKQMIELLEIESNKRLLRVQESQDAPKQMNFLIERSHTERSTFILHITFHEKQISPDDRQIGEYVLDIDINKRELTILTPAPNSDAIYRVEQILGDGNEQTHPMLSERKKLFEGLGSKTTRSPIKISRGYDYLINVKQPSNYNFVPTSVLSFKKDSLYLQEVDTSSVRLNVLVQRQMETEMNLNNQDTVSSVAVTKYQALDGKAHFACELPQGRCRLRVQHSCAITNTGNYVDCLTLQSNITQIAQLDFKPDLELTELASNAEDSKFNLDVDSSNMRIRLIPAECMDKKPSIKFVIIEFNSQQKQRTISTIQTSEWLNLKRNCVYTVAMPLDSSNSYDQSAHTYASGESQQPSLISLFSFDVVDNKVTNVRARNRAVHLTRQYLP